MSAESFNRVVIGLMATVLDMDEMSSQALNGWGEPRTELCLLTAPFGIAVFQSAVGLTPGHLVTEPWLIPDQGVSVALRDGVKQSVIDTADSPTQVGLVGRLAGIALSQAAGDVQ